MVDQRAQRGRVDLDEDAVGVGCIGSDSRTDDEGGVDRAVRAVAGRIPLHRDVRRPCPGPVGEPGWHCGPAVGIVLAVLAQESARRIQLVDVGGEAGACEPNGSDRIARGEPGVQGLGHRAEVGEAAGCRRRGDPQRMTPGGLVEPEKSDERGHGAEAPHGRGGVPAAGVVSLSRQRLDECADRRIADLDRSEDVGP